MSSLLLTISPTLLWLGRNQNLVDLLFHFPIAPNMSPSLLPQKNFYFLTYIFPVLKLIMLQLWLRTQAICFPYTHCILNADIDKWFVFTKKKTNVTAHRPLCPSKRSKCLRLNNMIQKTRHSSNHSTSQRTKQYFIAGVSSPSCKPTHTIVDLTS